MEALGIGDVGRAGPSQRRLAATADKNRRDVGHHPVDQAGSQEGAGQGRSTLEQDCSHPPLAQRLQQQLQIQAGIHARQADDVGAALQVRGVGVIGDGDEGGRGVVQDAGRGGGVGVAVHDDPQRLLGRFGVAYRQLGIVGLLGARAHHHRAALGPQPVAIGAGLGRGDPLA